VGKSKTVQGGFCPLVQTSNATDNAARCKLLPHMAGYASQHVLVELHQERALGDKSYRYEFSSKGRCVLPLFSPEKINGIGGNFCVDFLRKIAPV
jgi:hypothetical protein